MIPEGATFGPYRVLRRLGAGGAGEVFLAEHATPTAGEPARVALKVLDAGADDPAAQDLLRQVEAAGDLGNVHIIPFYRALREGNRLGIAMAYAPGRSLGDTLAPGGHVKLPLPPGVVARIVLQLAKALRAAHEAGLTHGDLKPTNVFVRTSPSGAPLAVVSDFGQAILARAAASLAAGRGTGPDQQRWIADQLRFAAPEQLRGPATPASDQYGLAALAYYLLTGRPPLQGDAGSLLAAIPADAPARPSRYDPTIPPEAERALLRALAKQPEARFASITVFAGLLADTLAMPVGAAPGASGVTAQMSSLAASRSGVYRPSESLHAAMPSRDGHARDVPDSLEYPLPADAPKPARRWLTIGAGIMVFALLLTCVLTATSLFSGPGVLQLGGNLGRYLGPNAAPTATAGGASDPQAAEAEARLASMTTSQQLKFSDDFASNTNHWATTSQSSIHDGRLSIANPTGAAPALLTTPRSLSLATLAARADVTHTKGSADDLAGLCFFINVDRKGKPTYYCYLASSQGRYEVWLYLNGGPGNGWSFVAGGYASALKSGLGQTNTLAVLADGKQGAATLFANGKYVAKVVLPGAPTSGNVGMLVLNLGAEASFGHYAVFSAS